MNHSSWGQYHKVLTCCIMLPSSRPLLIDLWPWSSQLSVVILTGPVRRKKNNITLFALNQLKSSPQIYNWESSTGHCSTFFIHRLYRIGLCRQQWIIKETPEQVLILHPEKSHCLHHLTTLCTIAWSMRVSMEAGSPSFSKGVFSNFLFTFLQELITQSCWWLWQLPH